MITEGTHTPESFIGIIEYDMEGDVEDPRHDETSLTALEEVEEWNEYNDYGDEDYGDEEDVSDEEEKDELVQMQPFTGELPPDTICSICLDVPQTPILISCTHYYCNACISQWLS